jgi:hypothetical protein
MKFDELYKRVYLNEQDKEAFANTEFMWLFDLPEAEYIPPPPPPFPPLEN